jgi:hypothetical protein
MIPTGQRALLISGMNFCLRGARSAPLKQKFIPLLSNADYLLGTTAPWSDTKLALKGIAKMS